MLMKILILLVMVIWLAASLPQTRFIWVPDYEQGSFDWIAANLRALIIDFLPLMVIFMESQLLTRHIDKARRSFGKRSDRDELDFDSWQRTYPTTERTVAKQMPRLFVMSTVVISVSYWAYYTEFGRDLALYHIEPLGLRIGGLIEFLVLVVYLTISALFTYGWGKLMSAFEVHTILEDFGKFVQSLTKSLTKQKTKKQPVPSVTKQSSKKGKRISTEKRRAKLFEKLSEDTNQRTEDLAKELKVSDQTIRNDYRVLEAQNKISYKGGRVTILTVQEGDF